MPGNDYLIHRINKLKAKVFFGMACSICCGLLQCKKENTYFSLYLSKFILLRFLGVRVGCVG